MHALPRQHGIPHVPMCAHPVIHVTTFGHARCWYDRTEIAKYHWRSQRARDVFLMLVSHDGHRMSRAALCAALWPECDALAAANNLRVSLYRLRQAFVSIAADADVIGADKQAVWLQLGHQAVIDVDEFRLAIASARRMYDAKQALPHLRRAADCYQGHYLTHDTDQDWTCSYREQFACEYTEAGIRLGRILLSMQLYTELIERMWRMIHLEVAVESAHQLLMQAYHATGNPEMVRRVYHSCQHLVNQQLGSSVTAETTRLYRTVLSS
ncbi:MAG: hypothetical protein FJ040_09520 [Chloroflexi bacterium]|nr:hypothetical protein [Chloroflexota bacterium]